MSHLDTQRSQFLVLHDQFINKQMLLFKIEQLDEFKRKQNNLEAPIENAQALTNDQHKNGDVLNVQYFEVVVNSQREKITETAHLAEQVKQKLDSNDQIFKHLQAVLRESQNSVAQKRGVFASMDAQQKERINS